MTYVGSRMQEIDDADLLQMIGRAGRPQFDESGVAVILTRSDRRMKYENLVRGRQLLESRLHEHLIEHMNAEIGLGTISNLQSAKDWLRGTFFYVRCQQNPQLYGFDNSVVSLHDFLDRKCRDIIDELEKGSLVNSLDGKLSQTPEGNAASKFYVRFPTIRRLCEVGRHPDLRKMVMRSKQS